MISFDTETTGVDVHHGVKPFFVTACDDNDDVTFFEWDVDPLTREPEIPDEDLTAVAELIESNDLVLQNAKFDAKVINTIIPDLRWPWERTHDTLLAGHLLASNQPHNLTDMAIHYLGVNVEPLEKRLQAACMEARRIIQQAALRLKRITTKPKTTPAKGKHARTDEDQERDERLSSWAIAKEGRPDMPSAKATVWKFDTWLPRAVAKADNYPADHPWWTVLRDYANADSEVTIRLWRVMEKIIHQRKLWAIYDERRKAQEVAMDMEIRGVTISKDRLDTLRTEYQEESARAGRICVNIAKYYGHDLVLPKNGVNNSLREFMFDKMTLEQLRSKAKHNKGSPSLDANAMQHYMETLDDNTKPKLFIKTLLGKRKRDTALQYMEGYESFWLPVSVDPDTGAGWYVLHPSLNQTGTDTLRWSSSNPNQQNISKKEGFNLRFMFGPTPDREWWSLDAKGIEDRLPAYKSLQQELIDIFEKADDPPFYGSNHLLRFSIVYPDIWAAAVKEVGLDKAGPYCKKKYAASNYQWCKNGGFAVQYGAVEKSDGWGTADRAFHKQWAHRLLKERLSKLEAYNQYWIKYAEKYGYVETMPDKSVDPERGYPILCSRTERGEIKPTVPLNYHIQSTAMWWTMKGMIRCFQQLREWREHDGFDGRIAMQVHDEMVFDFPKSRIHPKNDLGTRFRRSNLWRVKKLQDLMAAGGDDIGVPTPVGLEYNEHNWSEGVTLG